VLIWILLLNRFQKTDHSRHVPGNSRGNVIENLIRCQSIISRSAKVGAKMVFLPEASDFIAPASQSPSLAQSLKDSQFVHAIQSSALENDCWVSVGVHEKSTEDPNRCHNTSLVISNDGAIHQIYRKLHLFDMDLGNNTSANESRYIIPGKAIEKPLPTPIGHVGQLICYDLRSVTGKHRYNTTYLIPSTSYSNNK